jgi:hypothetical protein
MMSPRANCVLAFLLVSVSPAALAADATPEEAKRLTELMRPIMGDDADMLTIAANGDHYLVTFDLPEAKKKAQPKSDIKVPPLRMRVYDDGGGKWLGQLAETFEVNGDETKDGKTTKFGVKLGGFTISGTLDQTLQTFSEAKAELSDLAFSVKESGEGSEVNDVSFVAKNASVDLNSGLSAPLAERGAARFYVGLSDISGTIDIPPDESNPMGLKGSFALGKTDRTLELKGTRPASLMKLVNWAKAHPDEKSQESGRPELAKILKENLPVFDTASLVSTLKGFTIDTPFGKAGLENFASELSMNGIVADGAARQVLSISGLTLPDGLPKEILPDVALQLMPKSISLDLKVTDYNLAAPAAMLLDHLEKSGDEPGPEMEKQLLAALLPKGEATITLAPGSYVSPALTVNYEGSMVAGPEKVPYGQSIISATGLDQVIELLKVAPKELELEQGIYGILAAKGFGKEEPAGTVTWKIETTREGAVSINGVKMPGTGAN